MTKYLVRTTMECKNSELPRKKQKQVEMKENSWNARSNGFSNSDKIG